MLVSAVGVGLYPRASLIPKMACSLSLTILMSDCYLHLCASLLDLHLMYNA